MTVADKNASWNRLKQREKIEVLRHDMLEILKWMEDITKGHQLTSKAITVLNEKIEELKKEGE